MIIRQDGPCSTLVYFCGAPVNTMRMIFSLETALDMQAARYRYGFSGLTASQCFRAVEMLQVRSGKRAQVPPVMQKIVVLSILKVTTDNVQLLTFCDQEADILQRFVSGVEFFSPLLVTWDGIHNLMPILQCRMMRHRVQAKACYRSLRIPMKLGEEMEAGCTQMMCRHLDLKDRLFREPGSAEVELEDMAQIMGIVHRETWTRKSKVWALEEEDSLSLSIRCCELDVLRTYLLSLRYMVMCGMHSPSSAQHDYRCLMDMLKETDVDYLIDFRDVCCQDAPFAWQSGNIDHG